jgi:hypothetical protein
MECIDNYNVTFAWNVFEQRMTADIQAIVTHSDKISIRLSMANYFTCVHVYLKHGHSKNVLGNFFVVAYILKGM